MITVLGATGNTGGRVAARLAEAGEQVRAVSRSGRPVPGAEPWRGDATDRDFLTRAFTGAGAAYVLGGRSTCSRRTTTRRRTGWARRSPRRCARPACRTSWR
ncbi:NAD(P)H-binding protein [Pseudonocardia sp. RS11V-5]|nr:NAD(P)H-binding protein [Pseudonocardia terrae]